MKLVGYGRLVGFDTYEQKNKDTNQTSKRFVYYVLNGDIGNSDLYQNVELVKIIQTKHTLQELKPNMLVKYDFMQQKFGEKVVEIATNIVAVK